MKKHKLFVTVFATIHLVDPAWPAEPILLISMLLMGSVCQAMPAKQVNLCLKTQLFLCVCVCVYLSFCLFALTTERTKIKLEAIDHYPGESLVWRLVTL